MGKDETTLLDLLLELFPSVHLAGHLLAEAQCLGIDVLLDFLKQFLNSVLDTGELLTALLERVATHHLDSASLDVTGT